MNPLVKNKSKSKPKPWPEHCGFTHTDVDYDAQMVKFVKKIPMMQLIQYLVTS